MRHTAQAVLVGLFGGTGVAAAATVSALLLGTVRDGNGEGLPGVRVQVFLDGFPLASTHSDSLGAYRVVFPWSPEADSSVIAWWTAEESGLVPAVAVLRESAAARRLGLWEAGIPRVAAPAESVHDAVLRTRAAAGRRETGPGAPGATVAPPSGSAPDPAHGPETMPGAVPGSEPGTGIGSGRQPESTPAR
jgi:hypothetical protein